MSTGSFDDLITDLSADADTTATDPANDFDTAIEADGESDEGDTTVETPAKGKRKRKVVAKAAPTDQVTPASDENEYISEATRAEMALGAARVAQVAAEQERMRALEAELNKSE
jgi:hypothetical protein